MIEGRLEFDKACLLMLFRSLKSIACLFNIKTYSRCLTSTKQISCKTSVIRKDSVGEYFPTIWTPKIKASESI